MGVGDAVLKEMALEEARVQRGARVWIGMGKDGKCHLTYNTGPVAEELPVHQVDDMAERTRRGAQIVAQAIADAWTTEKMPAVNYASSGKRAVVDPVSPKDVMVRGERGRVTFQVNDATVTPPVKATRGQEGALLKAAKAAAKKVGATVMGR